jgi:D-erythrulose 4-kinase
MTYVYNAERGFKDEFLEGLTGAYARYLRRVPGASGVMSVAAPTPGRVSVLIGGGSGHYPAFAGLVGPGLCDGAIVGDLFSSPSAEQAYRCIRALDGGAGVLLAFGNYAGDVMHFGLAAERARAQSIDVRMVLVTDDVASAPPDQAQARRGIAGGFFVYRAAAAAAHEGRSMDEVERVARLANAATFSFGVAFGGCTFPGRDAPLFTVEPGRVELGLGIHGERGIETVDWQPAEQLADAIVAPVLRERPPGGRRVRVLLNGLGATKYEELFVLYRSIQRRLEEAGLEIVSPEVGEFVTSLDMAGCSLTLCWLDEELDRLLAAPAAAPGFRSEGAMAAPAQVTPAQLRNAPPGDIPSAGDPSMARSGPPSRLAQTVTAVLEAMAVRMLAIEGDLGRLDSVAGDGDHGAGMARGMSAAAAAAATAGPTGADVIDAAGAAFSDAAGGASGALWGAGLHAFGRDLAAAGLSAGDPPAGAADDPAPDPATVHRALQAALDAVMRLGGAQPGDKTLIDALGPFVLAFGDAVLADAAGASMVQAWTAAVAAADRGAADTARLAASKGRAAVHGTSSIGSADPGAVSLSAALAAGGEVLRARCG